MSLPSFGRSLITVRRLIGEAGWILFGQFMATAGAVAAIRILTEMLTPDAYGQLSLLLGFIVLAFNFAFRPFVQAGMRFRADYRSPAASAALRAETTRFVRYALIGVTLVLLVLGMVFGPGAGLPAWIGGVMVLVLVSDLFRTYETSMLNAARRHRAMSIWNAADGWARPLFALLAIWMFGGGVVSVLAAYGLATLLIGSLFPAFITLEGRAVPGQVPAGAGDGAAGAVPDRDAIRERIVRYVLPLLPLAFTTWVTGLGDRYIVAGFGSLELAGLYTATYALVSRPVMMLNAFLDTWLRPRLYAAAVDRRWRALRNVTLLWLAVIWSVGGLFVIAVVLLHAPIAKILLAEPYRHASSIMPWIAFGYLFQISAALAKQYSFAFEKTRHVLVNDIQSAIVTLVVSVPMIQAYGLEGAAMAVPIYFAVRLVLTVWMARVAFVAARADDQERS